MSSKDSPLFNVPRASNFGVLMCEEEEEERERESAKASLPASSLTDTTHSEHGNRKGENGFKGDTNGTAGEANGAGSEQQDIEGFGSDDWSRARRKPVVKPRTPRFGSYTRGGGSAVSAPNTGKKTVLVAPLSTDQFNAETTLELHDFPAAWRTSDIRKLLLSFNGRYRLKWQSDTSCWVHFEDSETASLALAEIKDEQAQLRRFSPENIQPAAAKNDLAPCEQTTLEVYGFPQSWRSADMSKLFEPYAGQCRFKWKNETACWVIFDSVELMAKASAELASDGAIKVRPYIAESISPKKNH